MMWNNALSKVGALRGLLVSYMSRHVSKANMYFRLLKIKVYSSCELLGNIYYCVVPSYHFLETFRCVMT